MSCGRTSTVSCDRVSFTRLHDQPVRVVDFRQDTGRRTMQKPPGRISASVDKLCRAQRLSVHGVSERSTDSFCSQHRPSSVADRLTTSHPGRCVEASVSSHWYAAFQGLFLCLISAKFGVWFGDWSRRFPWGQTTVLVPAQNIGMS